jgi:type IV secretory pathway VirB10-like protein
MRGFFSSQPAADDPPPAAAAMPADGGGWAGLSGRAKLGIMAGVAAAAIVAMMWPNLTSKPSQQPSGLPNQHAPAPISDYQAPPPVEEVAARVTGNTPPRTVTRTRPMPTEMALYTVKAPPPQVTAAAAPAAPGTAAPGTGMDGLPATNHAVMVRHPDFLIRAGDAIPCLPVEAQRSDKPNFSTCEVPTWFRSSNQRRGLLPPHTRLFGQIRDGLQAGEERLGIVFSLIQTKWFDMPIASPASDVMGRGGVDADVQTFFWDRAGAVALYALMDAAVGTGQNLATSALSNTTRYGGTSLNFTGPGEQLASREFDHRINKPPLGTRDQALPLTVIVGQNLDFYDACQQAMRVDPMACPLQ